MDNRSKETKTDRQKAYEAMLESTGQPIPEGSVYLNEVATGPAKPIKVEEK